MKKIFLALCITSSLLLSFELPLKDVQLQKVEQKLKENALDYTPYGFSNDEKIQYYKLMIFIDDMSQQLKNGSKITEEDLKLISEATKIYTDLDTKRYKAIKAEKKSHWGLVDYVKNQPENLDKIKQLIKDGADVNIKDDNGLTALDYAARNNQDEITKILMMAKAKVNPNAEDNDGYSLMMHALYNKKIELLEYLLKNGGNVNYRHEKLYKYNQTQNHGNYSHNYTLLHRVTSTDNDLKVIKILINAGADVNIKRIPDTPYNTTILEYAADDLSIEGHTIELGKTLDELGGMLGVGDKSKKKQEYKMPYRYPTYDSVSLLLGAGAKVEKNLPYLERISDVKTLKLMIDKGANLEVTDSSKKTPIYMHIRKKHYDAIKTLIEAGANLKHQDEIKETPITYCEKYFYDKKICQLLRNTIK